MKKNKCKYPFNRGEYYWSFYNNTIVKYIWDEISEEMHDDNPDTNYFNSEKTAKEFIKKLNNN